MRTADLDYELPKERIARYPLPERDASRLLVLAGDRLEHRRMQEWPELVPPGALVVLNDSRVIKARLLGERVGTGGRVEILLLRPVADLGVSASLWEALGRANRPLREGQEISVQSLRVLVRERRTGGTLVVELQGPAELIDRVGRVPIPPYLDREDEPSDEQRYQTVYACSAGSVAAPTAGLHLTEQLLARLAARGVVVARLTLHVGIGTFRPVSTEDLDTHDMHTERYVVSETLSRAVAEARSAGRAVIAVGTTVVRALESAQDPERPGRVRAVTGETNLLIQPGYRFSVVDALLTNFHQPRSTLLALVAAFAGQERLWHAYRVALERHYRFLSYGDAMWIPERS